MLLYPFELRFFMWSFNDLIWFLIDSFFFASRGNAFNFGDSTIDLNYRNCTSDSVRGLSGGGQDGPGDGNTIEYITIAEGGTAVDFGDLTTDAHDASACFSNGHGGLG